MNQTSTVAVTNPSLIVNCDFDAARFGLDSAEPVLAAVLMIPPARRQMVGTSEAIAQLVRLAEGRLLSGFKRGLFARLGWSAIIALIPTSSTSLEHWFEELQEASRAFTSTAFTWSCAFTVLPADYKTWKKAMRDFEWRSQKLLGSIPEHCMLRLDKKGIWQRTPEGSDWRLIEGNI